jgi:hypothetical protein
MRGEGVISEVLRGLMTRSGRSSVKSCVRAGDLDEPGLTGDAQSIYNRLVDEVIWPERTVDQGYLAVMVLPVVSLYQALRKRGWAQQPAVDAVESAFLATGARQRTLFRLLLDRSGTAPLPPVSANQPAVAHPISVQ